jgi:hypothetical protein
VRTRSDAPRATSSVLVLAWLASNELLPAHRERASRAPETAAARRREVVPDQDVCQVGLEHDPLHLTVTRGRTLTLA